MEDNLQQAREVLRVASRPVFLTGAGFSAESGVPTFRGAGGLWRTYRIEELATPAAFKANPRLVWDWYLERRRTVAACAPNVAHVALSRWSDAHEFARTLTQNVDGLHERAGHESAIRLHGSLWKNRCTSCGKERDGSALIYNDIPISPCCQAIERPAILWFGEEIPVTIFARAVVAIMSADTLVVIGTSGVVQPAADFVYRAFSLGKRVIEINPTPPELPAHIRISRTACDALPQLLEN